MNIFSVIATHPVFSAIVFFLAYSVLIFVLMEFSIDRSKDYSDGMMHVKINGWVIKFLYRSNCIGGRKYPKNLCQLYWGIWIYFPVSILFMTIAAVFAIALGAAGGATFCLYWFGTNLIGCAIIVGSDDKFHHLPYERNENNNQIIAPWKILVPSMLIGMEIIYPETTGTVLSSTATSTADMMIWLSKIFIAVISNKFFWISLGALFLIVLCCFGIPKVMRWINSSSTLAYIKAKKARFCPIVILEE